MDTVLVTGSAGFIGGYLVSELLDQGYNVIGIDNLSKYGYLSRSFKNSSNYKFINGDAKDSKLLTELLLQCDQAIACAAMIGGISYFHSYSYDLLAQNEKITAAICDAAINARSKNNRLKKLTYISSSMVYENTDKWPSVEGDELKILPPLSSYGFQKLAVEYFARAAWEQHKLPYTICRPFNCVGIGESKAIASKSTPHGNIDLAMSHVIPDLVQKVLKKQNPLKILGNGNQIRHFTYGGDIAKGIVMAMENSKAFNEDFNISTAHAHTVLEVAKIIWAKIRGDNDFCVEFETPLQYDVQKRIPSVNKAKELLGFEAKTDLNTMLDEVIPWVKDAISQGLI